MTEAITAWRIAARRYQRAIFSGEGTLKYGGRWLPPGCRAIYAAESIALALLEYRVNYPLPDLPPLVVAAVTVPSAVKLLTPEGSRLPRGWHNLRQPARCFELGRRWYEDGKYAVLKIPSAIVRREYNYLINTQHPDFKRLVLGKPQALPVDARL